MHEGAVVSQGLAPLPQGYRQSSPTPSRAGSHAAFMTGLHTTDARCRFRGRSVLPWVPWSGQQFIAARPGRLASIPAHHHQAGRRGHRPGHRHRCRRASDLHPDLGRSRRRGPRCRLSGPRGCHRPCQRPTRRLTSNPTKFDFGRGPPGSTSELPDELGHIFGHQLRPSETRAHARTPQEEPYFE